MTPTLPKWQITVIPSQLSTSTPERNTKDSVRVISRVKRLTSTFGRPQEPITFAKSQDINIFSLTRLVPALKIIRHQEDT